MNQFPYFNFYVHDWRSGHSTGEMTPEQKGGFIDLLAYGWDAEPPCSVPDDDARLAEISGLKKRWKRAGGAVKAQFLPVPEHPGRLRNPKQWWCYERALAISKKRSEAGKKGMTSRYGRGLQPPNNEDNNGHNKEDNKAITTGLQSVSVSVSGSVKPSLGSLAGNPTAAEGEGNGKTLRPRKTEVPEDWIPSSELVAWAEKNHPAVDWKDSTVRFIRNHRARGARFLRIEQAWQNWISGRFIDNRSFAPKSKPKQFQKAPLQEI